MTLPQSTSRIPKQIALSLVVVIGLLAAWPLFEPRLPHGADTLTHFYKLVQFDHLVRQGILYTRWFPHKYSGFGAPLFQYYAPLAYYVAEGFRLPGLDSLLALRMAFGLSLMGAGLGMYLWVRDALDDGSALIAAAAYVCGPYMFFAAYFRGGFTEMFALMLMPFVLWAFRRLAYTGKALYLAAGAVTYAGVVLSHNLTALIFSPALLAYTLILAIARARPSPGPNSRRSPLIVLWAAIALGLGLSAFFWLPALVERDAVQTGLLYATPGLDYHHHFIRPQELFSMPLTLTTRPGLSIVAAFLALIGAAWQVWKPPRNLPSLEIQLAIVIAAAGTFMALPASVGIWEAVPPMRLFQFPHRFLGVATVFMAFLAGAGAYGLKGGIAALARSESEETVSPADIHLAQAAVLLIIGGLLVSHIAGLSQVRHFQPLPEVDVNFIMLKEREIAPSIGGFTGIYVPAGVEAMPPFEELAKDGPQRLDQSSLPRGAEVVAADWGLLRYDLTISTPQPFLARFRTFYFPGWQAQLDGQPAPIAVAKPYGQISVKVPAGDHRLTVWFGSTPIRTAATVLSILSAAVLCLVVASIVLRRRASP